MNFKAVCILLLLSLALFGCAETPVAKEPVVGGKCSYDTFQGKCTIVSVGNDFSVDFKFVLTQNISTQGMNGFEADTLNRLTAQGYVSGRESAGDLGLNCLKTQEISSSNLDRCGLKVNSTFDCEHHVETKGTCTPLIFNFKDISP